MRIARDATRLAIETVPNWRGSRFSVEDIQRLDTMHRDLSIMTMEDA